MVGVAILLLLTTLSISEETLIKQHTCDNVPGKPISSVPSPRLYCLNKDA